MTPLECCLFARAAQRQSGVRLALADATVPRIATFTGHSLRDVDAILDAHDLGRDVHHADIAVVKPSSKTRPQDAL